MEENLLLKAYTEQILSSILFAGIHKEELKVLIHCLAPKVIHYKKNEYILRCGESIASIGLLLSGMVMIERDDIWGNLSIISEITPSMSFAESYACFSHLPVDINILAKENSTVLFFNISKFIHVCSAACEFHNRIVQNLLTVVAEKNLILNQKINYVSKKKIRDRLLAYLSAESIKNKKDSFESPFNRQELADFLFVDRSALSNEISKLRQEGIISCRKNKFKIIIPITT